MPDREKVISAYECVITRGKSVCECGKCDYHIKDSAVFFCDNQRVLTDVLALLKEQDETIKELQNAYGYLQKRFFEVQDKLLKEQEELINELLELGYPHNFQHEAPWVVDYLYELTEIIKKAFKAKERR